MARANKYTSINFNHIYDKNLSATSNNVNNPTKQHPSSPSFYSSISSPSSNNLYKNHLPSTRSHGRMLVLTRPTPKPIISTPPAQLSPSPQTPPTHQPQAPVPDHSRSEPESDQISLRPLGRTGPAGSPLTSPVLVQERQREAPALVGSPKPNKFVPPHLRPGFVGREEKPGPVQRQQHQQQQQPPQGHFGSPSRYGDDKRPKSGGGYDRIHRDRQSDVGLMNRPRSSGNRPSSSG